MANSFKELNLNDTQLLNECDKDDIVNKTIVEMVHGISLDQMAKVLEYTFFTHVTSQISIKTYHVSNFTEL